MRLNLLVFTAALTLSANAFAQAAPADAPPADKAERPTSQADAPEQPASEEAAEPTAQEDAAGAETATQAAADSAGPVSRDQVRVGEVIHGAGGAAIAPIAAVQDSGAVVRIDGRPALLPFSGIARRNGKLTIGLTRAQLVAAARARLSARN